MWKNTLETGGEDVKNYTRNEWRISIQSPVLAVLVHTVSHLWSGRKEERLENLSGPLQHAARALGTSFTLIWSVF